MLRLEVKDIAVLVEFQADSVEEGRTPGIKGSLFRRDGKALPYLECSEEREENQEKFSRVKA